MAFAACVTDQYKQDVLNGVHQPGDTYKVALGTQAAATNCNKGLTNYAGGSQNMNGELAASGGYSTGGVALSGFTVGLSGDTAYLTFSNPQWTSASFTADCAVIYNSTRSNKAVAVLAFGSTTVTSGTFTIQLPAAGASSTVTIS